jgi:hypothetical protein
VGMATSWSYRRKSGRGTIETRGGALRVADPGLGVTRRRRRVVANAGLKKELRHLRGDLDALTQRLACRAMRCETGASTAVEHCPRWTIWNFVRSWTFGRRCHARNEPENQPLRITNRLVARLFCSVRLSGRVDELDLLRLCGLEPKARLDDVWPGCSAGVDGAVAAGA